MFAATEALHSPNAFLAHELTDGVLYFLSLENENQTLSAEEFAEFVSKIVRELGYPAIAKICAELSEDDTDDLQSAVYGRDLLSAHLNELLHLDDLEQPNELLGVALAPLGPPPVEATALSKAFTAARKVAATFIAVNGIEHAIATAAGDCDESVSSFLFAVESCRVATRLHVVLNLNSTEIPAWAAVCDGPLFPNQPSTIGDEVVNHLADELLKNARNCLIYWHLSQRDFSEKHRSRLKAAVTKAVEGVSIEFVFDHPRQQTQIAPGMDERDTAILSVVQMNLPRLVEQLGSETLDETTYLRKLESLARFAKLAGHAKQDYLRRKGGPDLLQGFLLERAVQIVLPIGVVKAAIAIAGKDGNWEAIVSLANRSIRVIETALVNDRPRCYPRALPGRRWVD